MGRFAKIARRTFLIGCAAVAGGVAFGVYKARQTPPNPLTETAGSAVLTPYVVINAQGISIIAPRAEMGQGVHTTLAALVAEELDVTLDQVNVIHGPAAKAYYNGALMGSALPVAEYKKSERQEWITTQMEVLPKLFGMQITGGSTSTVDAYEKMRRAGAAARETLKAAAAARTGTDAGALNTEVGEVVFPDGARIAYTDLAAEAATLELPDPVPLREPSKWKILGRSQPRTDMAAKCTGTAVFATDIRSLDMKFATVRRNPHLLGGVTSYDPAPALAMPGVEKVIELDDGIAVVASNTWLAMQAAEAIEIDWGQSPLPATQNAIMQTINAVFDQPENSALRDDGDIDAGLAQGAVIEAAYEVPFLAHATMEPMTATALFDEGKLEIWSGNQAPLAHRDAVAAALDIDPEAVTVHTTLMGGGFGRRGEYDFSVAAAKVAQAMPGTPVAVTWSREEDMTHDYYRPAAMARFRGAVANGTAVALEARIAGPSAAFQAIQRLAGFGGMGPDKVHVEGSFDQPYAIPNYRVAGHLAELDVPIGFWRSVGNSFNGFFHESFIDELAHAAGRDPLELRLELVQPEHEPSAKLLEAVREMSNWTGKTPDGVGRGVALTYSFGTPVAQVVEVVNEDDIIRIARAWIAGDPVRALYPEIVATLLEGGMIYGLSAAVMGEITFTDVAVDQYNFPYYDALRIHTTPVTEVRILENNHGIGGIGEPGTPPAAPALANAVFDLTGQRPSRLPLIKDFNFLS